MATTLNLQGQCPACGHLSKNLESKMRHKASEKVGEFLDQTYFERIPLAQIDFILEEYGFNSNS